jgi:hypothetical protein
MELDERSRHNNPFGVRDQDGLGRSPHRSVESRLVGSTRLKPCPGDIRHKILIGGDELRELKRHALAITEAFGLDRKIERYQGTRPLTLFRWDIECLMDMIEYELANVREYPDRNAPEFLALESLGKRLRQEYDLHYGHEKKAGLEGR